MGSVLKKETDIVFKTIKPFNLHQLLLSQIIFKKINWFNVPVDKILNENLMFLE